MKELKVGRYWLHWGKLSGYGLGIKIDKYGMDIDLVKFYVGIEI